VKKDVAGVKWTVHKNCRGEGISVGVYCKIS